MVWAIVSSSFCFCWLYRASPVSAAKNIIILISIMTIWWCPFLEPSLVLLEKGVCYDQSVVLAKLCYPLPACFILYSKAKHVCYSRYLLTFAFQSPVVKITSFFLSFFFFFFFLMLVLEGLVSLHRTDQLQLLWHQCLRRRLGLLWCFMVCLGNELRSFCHFWDCTQELHFGLFCWLCGCCIYSNGFPPTVVDIPVIWIKFTHSRPF